MKPQRATTVFRPPFHAWSDDALLNHYNARHSIQYFAVADESQTARATMDVLLHNRFSFNHEAHQLPAEFDWTANPSRDVEWMILWHKFYYAVGLGIAYHETKDQRYADKWMALTESWIDRVPLDLLPSDVTGRRIQNWIFAHYYFVTLNAEAVTPAFYRKFLHSLHEQVCFLLNHLTAARNHRTLELYAIFLAAVVFPEFNGADDWLDFAQAELLKNMQADLLSDGVQCELSTDYHHLVLRNYLCIRRLAALNNIAMPEEMDSLIKQALEFAKYVHKPDGFIPSLSDGDSRNFLSLLAQGYELYGDEEMRYVASQGVAGEPPALRSKAFPDSGYYVLRSGWGERERYEDERYLVFDCGPLGAGNHGHLDCLNFEMAAFGESLIVDPGRYTYCEAGETNWRALFRGTSAHNTVTIDDRNQTRYEFHTRKFKIKGDAPDHELKTFVSRDGFDFLHGLARSHEYPVLHERKILFVRGAYWIVSDVLRAAEPHEYDLRFHLSDTAFGKTTIQHQSNTRLISAPKLVIAQAADADITADIEDGFISRTYGVKHAAPVVSLKTRAANACYNTILFPHKAAAPTLTVENIPVFTGHRLCAPTEATALRITIDDRTDHFFLAHQASAQPYCFGNIQPQQALLFFRQDAQQKRLCEFSL